MYITQCLCFLTVGMCLLPKPCGDSPSTGCTSSPTLSTVCLSTYLSSSESTSELERRQKRLRGSRAGGHT